LPYKDLQMENKFSRTKFLRLSEVKERTGLSRSSIYRKISDETFPKQVPLGLYARAVGWVEAEIDEWLQEQISRSRSADVSGHNEKFRKMENPSPQSDCALQPDGGQQ
jgi:prophage regulatory protein